MNSSRWTMWLLALLGVGLGACTDGTGRTGPPPQPPAAGTGAPAQPPPSDPATQLLDRAIEAAGGAAKLEAASAYRCKARATVRGVVHDGILQYKPGRSRMDGTSPLGFPITRVEAIDDCWQQRGPAVIPCRPEGASGAAQMHQLVRLSQLWPLKKGEPWKLTADTVMQDGKEHDALRVKSPAVEGTLLFDKQTHLVAGLQIEATFMGTKGTFAGVFSEHELHCGVQLPTRWQASFQGKQFVDEKMTDFECGPLDDAVFARPQQVADGTIEQRTYPAKAAICVTHVGPYQGIGPKLMQLMGHVLLNRAPMIGPPMLIYRKAPPAVTDPKSFETDVCEHLNEPADESTLSGGLTARQLEQTDVLVGYGVGTMESKMKEVAGRLMAEAKKRKLAPAGPMRQIAHTSPKSFPPNQVLIELQLPVKK